MAGSLMRPLWFRFLNRLGSRGARLTWQSAWRHVRQRRPIVES